MLSASFARHHHIDEYDSLPGTQCVLFVFFQQKEALGQGVLRLCDTYEIFRLQQVLRAFARFGNMTTSTPRPWAQQVSMPLHNFQAASSLLEEFSSPCFEPEPISDPALIPSRTRTFSHDVSQLLDDYSIISTSHATVYRDFLRPTTGSPFRK